MERIEGAAASDCLVVQLLKQLTAHAESLERLQTLCHAQQKELGMAHQTLGRKRKEIQDLRSEGAFQHRRISLLEHGLLECQSICSKTARRTKVGVQQLKNGPFPAESAATKSATTSQATSVTNGVSEGHSSQDGTTEEALAPNSTLSPRLAKGLTRLLAANCQTAGSQVSNQEAPRRGQQAHEYEPPTKACSISCSFGLHKFSGAQVPKRSPYQILARHPEAPRSIPVVCKQLAGKMLLGDCGQSIEIQVDCVGSPILGPAEFEAAAGCNRGKNWKANIKVKGSNGRNQMLKVWLPSLIQLVGDHVKIAVASNIPICNLLDVHSGLRLRMDEQQ